MQSLIGLHVSKHGTLQWKPKPKTLVKESAGGVDILNQVLELTMMKTYQ